MTSVCGGLSQRKVSFSSRSQYLPTITGESRIQQLEVAVALLQKETASKAQLEQVRQQVEETSARFAEHLVSANALDTTKVDNFFSVASSDEHANLTTALRHVAIQLEATLRHAPTERLDMLEETVQQLMSRCGSIGGKPAVSTVSVGRELPPHSLHIAGDESPLFQASPRCMVFDENCTEPLRAPHHDFDKGWRSPNFGCWALVDGSPQDSLTAFRLQSVLSPSRMTVA